MPDRPVPVSSIDEQPRGMADIRRPIQKRSRDRFEAILDAAERMLETSDPASISVHRLAAELEMSAPSIYHFFPDASLVFAALAERYLHGFEVQAADLSSIKFDNWQELQTYNFRQARSFFNANAPARKILLGPALSFDIRTRDLQSDIVMAKRGIEQMRAMFVVPYVPDLIARSIELIVINDALWALSIHRHGTITEEMEEQARRARLAYARTFFPEFMAPIEQALPSTVSAPE